MKIIEFIIRLFREQPARFLAVLATAVIATLLEGVAVALFIPLLSLAQSGEAPAMRNFVSDVLSGILSVLSIKPTVANVTGLIFAVAASQQGVAYINQKLFYNAYYRFQTKLRRDLFEAILSANWPFFLQQKVGDLTNALTLEGIRASEAFYQINLLLTTGIVMIVYLGLAATLSWKMALGAILIGLSLVTLFRRWLGLSTRYGAAITEANSSMQSQATEQLSNAKLIKSSAIENLFISEFNRDIEAVSSAYYKNGMNQALVKSLYELSAVAILCTGIYVAIGPFNMSLASLVVFLFIFYRLVPRLSNSQTAMHQIMSNMPGLEQIDRLRNLAVSMQEAQGGHVMTDLTSGIFLKQVGFHHLPGQEILRQADIAVAAGRTTALIGSSGAGKSTIIDLILGLIGPTEGHIVVDDIDLQELNLHAWRGLVGYVPQDTAMLNASIKDNIRFGATDVSDDEIFSAVLMAQARDFVDRLPEGYDTIVGDRGVRLSGGQRQRLALARALVRKPQLLILDEATSALDAESEVKIQEAVTSLSGKMTILIVSHRLATVRQADAIYVVEDGQSLEFGTWKELESKQGRFAELKALQGLD